MGKPECFHMSDLKLTCDKDFKTEERLPATPSLKKTASNQDHGQQPYGLTFIKANVTGQFSSVQNRLQATADFSFPDTHTRGATPVLTCQDRIALSWVVGARVNPQWFL